jgi:hypothetical protein
VFNTSRRLDGFKPQILSADLSTSGTVIPPPGWVKDGGSLAGKDISNPSTARVPARFSTLVFAFLRGAQFVSSSIPSLGSEPVGPGPQSQASKLLVDRRRCLVRGVLYCRFRAANRPLSIALQLLGCTLDLQFVRTDDLTNALLGLTDRLVRETARFVSCTASAVLPISWLLEPDSAREYN